MIQHFTSVICREKAGRDREREGDRERGRGRGREERS